MSIDAIKDGYKKSEIGVIPEDWEVTQLKNIGSIVTGNTPKTSKQEFYKDGTRLWVSPSDLGKVKEIKETNSRLSELGFLKTRILPAKSILVTCIGSTIGKIGIASEELSTNQQINSIICNDENNPDFYYYVLSQMKDYIQKLAGTQAVPLLNKTDFSMIKIPLPPLPEQKRIAEILSTVDGKIALVDEQIEKAEELKKGLMQKLLSEGIGHTAFKDSELGRIPESWEVVKLGECIIGKGQYGINAAAVDFDENLPTYLRITDIDENGKFIKTKNKSVETEDIETFSLEEGDIVFARTGNTTGKTYLYNPNDGELIFAGFLIRFKPNQDILDSRFLKYFTETPFYWKWVKVSSSRTGQPGINGNEYGHMPLFFPPLQEQKQIAEILSTADEKLETLREKKGEYEELKKGLMQKLLSGKVRTV